MQLHRLTYAIRKTERGLGVLIKLRASNISILNQALQLATYKKELYLRTGRCMPDGERWPI